MGKLDTSALDKDVDTSHWADFAYQGYSEPNESEADGFLIGDYLLEVSAWGLSSTLPFPAGESATLS